MRMTGFAMPTACLSPSISGISTGGISGPVVIPHLYDGHGRTFWLFNYEGFKIRRGSTVTSFIPTAAQFTGDLSDQPSIFDPELTHQIGVDGNGNPIYAGQQISCNGRLNVICPDRINPAAKNYAAVMYPMIQAVPGASSAQIVNTAP